MGSQSNLAICVLGLAVLALAMLMVAEDAQGQLPSIHVSVAEGDREQTAEITGTTNQVLEFDGEVLLTKPVWFPGQSVTVTLTLEMQGTNPVWNYTFQPPTLEFTASGTKNFTALVTAPAGLLAADFFNLIFDAETADIPFYDKVTGTALVHVAQYYGVGRQFSTEPLRVKQGDSLEFNVTIINRGNGGDTFTLALSNEEELNFLKLFVYFDRQARLDPGEETRIKLRLESDQEAQEGTFQLNFTITSDGSSSDPDADTVVNFADFTVVVEPSLTSQLVEYWYVIAAALAVLIVISLFLVRRRRKRREGEGDEPDGDELDEDEEDDILDDDEDLDEDE